MKFFSSTHYTPQQLQNIAIDLFCDILGSILSAIGIYTFAKLAKLRARRYLRRRPDFEPPVEPADRYNLPRHQHSPDFAQLQDCRA